MTALVANSRKIIAKRVTTCSRTGHVSEVLAKSLDAGALDSTVTPEDKTRLLEAMREWGVLDKDMKYSKNMALGSERGWERAPGGGVNEAPIPNDPFSLSEALDSKI